MTSSSATVVLTAFSDSACSSAAAGTLNNGSGTVASSGVATFSTVSYTGTGTIYLKASSGSLTTDCSTAIVVSAAAPSASMVKDINTMADSAPSGFVYLNGFVYYNACTLAYGCELWRSNTTSNATTLVKDIRSGSASSDPGNLIVISSTIFFHS